MATFLYRTYKHGLVSFHAQDGMMVINDDRPPEEIQRDHPNRELYENDDNRLSYATPDEVLERAKAMKAEADRIKDDDRPTAMAMYRVVRDMMECRKEALRQGSGFWKGPLGAKAAREREISGRKVWGHVPGLWVPGGN